MAKEITMKKMKYEIDQKVKELGLIDYLKRNKKVTLK